MLVLVFFFQAEDGIRDLVRSRGLGDVYKRQQEELLLCNIASMQIIINFPIFSMDFLPDLTQLQCCLLYTSDAADERSSVDLGGRRIIKKKKNKHNSGLRIIRKNSKHNSSESNDDTEDTQKKTNRY